VVTVIINYSNSDETMRLDVPTGTMGESRLFITSGKDGEDLKPFNKIDGTGPFLVPKTSIVTLVTKLL
jgi:3-deoxy-D-manno-octulosonate 8-phosphate phosphatase KdsC-like HAD superfamily phosphatase